MRFACMRSTLSWYRTPKSSRSTKRLCTLGFCLRVAISIFSGMLRGDEAEMRVPVFRQRARLPVCRREALRAEGAKQRVAVPVKDFARAQQAHRRSERHAGMHHRHIEARHTGRTADDGVTVFRRSPD